MSQKCVQVWIQSIQTVITLKYNQIRLSILTWEYLETNLPKLLSSHLPVIVILCLTNTIIFLTPPKKISVCQILGNPQL
jgi:hypothetical protein